MQRILESGEMYKFWKYGGFACVPRKFMSPCWRTTSCLFLPFSPGCQRKEWKMLSLTSSSIPLTPRAVTAMLAACFYWPRVSFGEVIQLCQQEKAFWCTLAVSPSEGSANIAVLLQLVQRAGSVARTYSTINKSIMLMCVFGGACYMPWSRLCWFQNRIISLNHFFFLISLLL